MLCPPWVPQAKIHPLSCALWLHPEAKRPPGLHSHSQWRRPQIVPSTWPPILRMGLTLAGLCPYSNGILYQYPDRTDVIPLLSVNMG